MIQRCAKRWQSPLWFYLVVVGRSQSTTTASLPTPVVSTTQVAQNASPTTDWPCVKPPILTEHQETLLEQMTQSGRPDLVQEAAEIRSKLCAAWAARATTP